MLKEQWNKSIRDFNEKMTVIGTRVKDASETAEIMGMQAQDALDEKIADMKGNVVAAQEQFRISSEHGKMKLNSELIKAQMNIAAIKQAIEEKKVQLNQAKMEEYISETLDYACECQKLSDLLMAEAKLAELQAESAIITYEEMYGDAEKE